MRSTFNGYPAPRLIFSPHFSKIFINLSLLVTTSKLLCQIKVIYYIIYCYIGATSEDPAQALLPKVPHFGGLPVNAIDFINRLVLKQFQWKISVCTNNSSRGVHR